MKFILSVILVCFFMSPVFAAKYYSAQTPVHVNGYTRANGTHVHSYYRAEPGQAQKNNGY